MTLWRTSSVAGAACLALTLAACGGGASGSSGAADGELEKTELTVGSLPLADYAALYWAEEHGFFEDEGLDVTIEAVQGGPAGVQKVVAGELDFTNSTVFVAAMSQDSGLPIRLVVPTSALADGGMGIYVREDSPIRGLEDLQGKSVGTNTTKNIGDITFNALAESEGVDVEPDWVEVPFPEMVSGVKAKSIDAGYVPEPFASQARAEGLREVVDLTTGPNNHLVAASYVSSQRFIDENPDTTAAFVEAMYAAGDDMMKNEAEVREWLPSIAQLDEDIAQKMPLPPFYGELDRAGVEAAVGILKDQELVKQELEVEDVLWEPSE